MIEGRTNTTDEFIVQLRAYLTVHSNFTFEEINRLIADRVNDPGRVAWHNRKRCTKSRWVVARGQLVTDNPEQEEAQA